LADAEQILIDVAGASRMLGISRSHAYDLIVRGDLPSIRLGRRVLVPIEALRSLVASALSVEK
jgi:excisionase family DNA binding protein